MQPFLVLSFFFHYIHFISESVQTFRHFTTVCCPLYSTGFITAYLTAGQTLMWLFSPSQPTRLLIPVRDQRPKSFQSQTGPHMIHIIHHDWQTKKDHRAL